MNNINSSNLSDLLSFLNSQHQKQINVFPPDTFQTNSSSKLLQNYSKRDNIITINSSLNIPSPKNNINVSLNDQENDGDENDPIFREYSIINEKRNQTIDEIKDINEKIKDNNSEIDDIKIQLKNLKTEKKQKQADIINLLSNKESIEEIYKNRIYLLINHNNSINDNDICDNDIIIDINLKKDKDTINSSIINSNNNTNTGLPDVDALSNDNFKITVDDIKESDKNKFIEQVTNMVDDILRKKEKKMNSLILNIINNSYEVFINNINEVNEKNNEMIINNFFTKISLFISNHSLGEFPEANINILLRYLILINSINKKLNKYIKFVNKKYKERKRDLKDMINNLEKTNKDLNQKKNKLEKIMKEFDEKFEMIENNKDFLIEKKASIEDDNIYHQIEIKNVNINDKTNNENNKNAIKYLEINKEVEKDNLKSLNKRYENNINNNIFIPSQSNNNTDNNDNTLNSNQILKNSVNDNTKSIENAENEKDSNSKNINIKNKIDNTEEKKNEEQLSHEVIIEYEDGIDQNVEINYEEDDMSNEYNFEKENELINQGINPYNNNEINIINDKKELNKHIYHNEPNILNNTEENDKLINNYMQNNNNIENNKNKNLIIYVNKNDNNNNNIPQEDDMQLKNKNRNINYYIMKDEHNKNTLDLIGNNTNNNKYEDKKKKRNIKNNNLDIYNSDNHSLKRNNIINNHKSKEIKDNNEKSLNSNIRKINDYTFNISINNSNKNIFTENMPKKNSNNNIQNLKTKNINNTQNIKLKNKNENDEINLFDKKLKKSAKSISLNKSNEKFQLAKKIKYDETHYIEKDNKNNITKNEEEIITYKISSITKNELQGISVGGGKGIKNKNNNDNKNNFDDIIKKIEIGGYKRIQRIKNKNSNGNDNNSNYNNSEKNNIKDNSLIFSPIKNELNNSSSMNNNFDSKIHIKGRKNHNYISIINITNNAPIEKKEDKEKDQDNKESKDNKDKENKDNRDKENKDKDKDNMDNIIYDDHKIYTKKIKGNFNKKKLKEQNNLSKEENKKEINNEYDIDDKFEVYDNENNSRDNDIDMKKKKNSGETNNDIIEPIKMSKNIKKIDLTQYLNNSKNRNNINDKIIKNKSIDNNIHNNKIKKNLNKEYQDNGIINLTNIEHTPIKNISNNKININKKNKFIPNDFFNNVISSTLKITKSREIDINEIKNTKLSIIKKRNFSKTIANKNAEKEKCKLIFNNNKNVKNATSLNKNKNKSNYNKIKNKNSVSSLSFKSGNNKVCGLDKKDKIIKEFSKINENKNNYTTYNSTKRANSLNIDKNVNNNLELKAYRSKNNKIGKNVVNITSNNKEQSLKNQTNLHNIVSPNTIKKLKIINIPVSKMKKLKNDYNSNTYDGNFNRNRSNLKTKNNANKIFLDYSELNEEDNKYSTNWNINSVNLTKSPVLTNIYNNLEYFDNNLNILTKGTKQVLCYYRIYKRNNIELNILENSSYNLEIFGFSQGYIFLNLKTDTLKFTPKANNNNELCITLKNIIGLQIEQYMMNVIKYNSINNELKKIKDNTELLVQNDKNKSLYKIFSFNLLVNDLYEGKIECILNNFEIYFLLIKYFEKIVEYNQNNDIYDHNNYNNYNFKSI